MLSAHLAAKIQSAISNCCASAPAESCLLQAWTADPREDGVSLLRTKGSPFVCWGSDERLALFRYLSCETGVSPGAQDLVAAAFERGEAVAAPSESAASPANASRAAHLGRCRMAVALALPLYEHADRQKVLGALEISRMESQPAPSYTFLSSLASCLQDSGIYTCDLKTVLLSGTQAPAPPQAADADTSSPTVSAAHKLAALDSATVPTAGTAEPAGAAGGWLAAVKLEGAPMPAVPAVRVAGPAEVAAAAADALLPKAGSPRSSRSASTTGVLESEDADTSNSGGGGGGGGGSGSESGSVGGSGNLSGGTLVRAASGSSVDVRSGASSGPATPLAPGSTQGHGGTAAPHQLQLLPPPLTKREQPLPPAAPQRSTALLPAAAGADPGDLAALPGLNDAQRLMFMAFAPAFNTEMKQKARSLAARRAAAEGPTPARHTLMPDAAAAARPAAPAISGSRKQLKRLAEEERQPPRRQRPRLASSRRVNIAGSSQPGHRYSGAPMFAPTDEVGGWEHLAASSTNSLPGLPFTGGAHVAAPLADAGPVSLRARSTSGPLPIITTPPPSFSHLLPDVPLSLADPMHDTSIQDHHMPLHDAPIGFYGAQPAASSAAQGSFQQHHHQAQGMFQLFDTPTPLPNTHLPRGPPPVLPQHPHAQMQVFDHAAAPSNPAVSSVDTYGSGFLDSLMTHQDDHLDAALLEGLEFDLDMTAPEFAAMASAMVH